MQDAPGRTASVGEEAYTYEVVALPEMEMERAALPLQNGLRTIWLFARTRCTNEWTT